MNTKALERLSSDLSQLKDLDKEISAIERIAQQAAEGNGAKLTIALNLPPAERAPRRRDKKNKGKDKSAIAHPLGFSPVRPMFLGGIPSIIEFAGMNNILALDNSDFNEEVNDTMLLQVLGLLLSEKLAKRNTLVNRIKSRGVKL